MKDPLPWPCGRSEQGPDMKIFKARFDELTNPRTGRTLRAVVLEARDWVNVIPLTREGKVVAVRQYRFGAGCVTTEIPAGIVEEGEDPRAAAERELLEETGCAGGAWESLGWVEPNPAFLDNRCHFWLARGVARVREPRLEDGEDIAVVELDEAALRREIAEGRMRHTLALSALAMAFDLRGAMGPGEIVDCRF